MKCLTILCICAVSVVLGRYVDRRLGTKAYSEHTREELLRELAKILIEYLEDDLEDSQDEPAVEWLYRANRELEYWSGVGSLNEWNFSTNVTKKNANKLSADGVKIAKWFAKIKKEGEKINMAELNEDNRRQLRLMLKSDQPKDVEVVRETSQTNSQMLDIYDTSEVCFRGGKCLTLEPEVLELMSKSRQPDLLREAWEGWRDVTAPIKPLYAKYVNLKNEAAVDNGYHDYGEYWRDSLFDETPDLEASAEKIWQEVKPLYQELHAYVRHKLRHFYKSEVVGHDGTIPAHILGNMWAQDWKGIYDIVRPYPSADWNAEVEAELKKKFDVHGLFRLSEKFYSSIGLFNMTDKFWNYSMVERPSDRQVQCHASAFYMYREHDFRIKMCTQVNLDYLETIHHEMGHVEYYMAYENQPTVYRDGANSAFHEAIGDTMALSVINKKHLQAINLLSHNYTESKESDINMLLERALVKLAFLPFGYLVDKWRWAVFRGDVTPANYNKYWWQLRLRYQGVVSPVPRSEENFDPGAKFHIPSNSPYMSYFFSHILQFQFYKKMCELSDHEGELHTCDFYQSKAAGKHLKNMLSLGSSKPWQESLYQFTGSREVSAQPLMEYFRPLMTWLKEENRKNGVKTGWPNAKIKWAEF